MLRTATRSMVLPLVLARMLAFCRMSRPALRLMLPPEVLSVRVAPRVISELLPPACSRIFPMEVTVPPARDSILPAVVTRIKLASEVMLDCAVSAVCVESRPVVSTWLTFMALSVPIWMPLASVRNRPPVAPVPLTSAASLLTLISRALAPVPAPLPLAAPVVMIRSSSALILVVSVPPVVPASVMVDALILTSPVAVLRLPSCRALVAT